MDKKLTSLIIINNLYINARFKRIAKKQLLQQYLKESGVTMIVDEKHFVMFIFNIYDDFFQQSS